MAKVVRFVAPRRGKTGFDEVSEKSCRATSVARRSVREVKTVREVKKSRTIGTAAVPATEITRVRSTSPNPSRFTVYSGARTGVVEPPALEPKTEKAQRYKMRARVLLHQAAALLAELDASEQRLAWLLEDCADLLVRCSDRSPEGNRTRERLRGAALKADRALLKADCDSLKADCDSLKADCDSLKADRDPLKADRDPLKADRDSLRADRDSLRADRDSPPPRLS